MAGKKDKSAWTWESIELEFLAGRWRTLGEIAKFYNIPYTAVQQQACRRGWARLKKETQLRTKEKVIEALAEDNAAIIRRTREEIIQIADMLMDQGAQRFKDDEGNILKRVINGVPTAVNALTQGAKLKMSALGMTRGDGEPDVAVTFLNNGELNVRSMADADLDRFINAAQQRLAEMERTGGPRKGSARKSKKQPA